MAAPANCNEFLDLIHKSGVAEEKRLESYLQKLRTAGAFPADATKLAQMLVRDGLLTQFQAEQLLQGKWKRFSIGKYKVLERLGSGGMGSVFLCEHKLMRRRVAVKVLPTAKAQDEESLKRFYREARAAAALDHPNIVHAYDIDQDDNLHFLVMEYVDGTNLQDLVKKTGPLPIAQACHYIRQAALGLEHAHQKNMVHRDIKPGNILVDRKGQIKVLDMGLARLFDEDELLTKKFDDNVLGTADYLAPEQAEDSHDVDIRADIYGLGATFYFLLTGKTPFGDGTVAQKLMWHQHKEPRPIPEIRPEVPQALWAIVARMMAKKAPLRYQVPRAVAEALAPFTPAVIAPPPHSEMPRLSPAAAGPGSSTNAGAGSGSGSGSGNRTPVTVPASAPDFAPPPAAMPEPARVAAEEEVNPEFEELVDDTMSAGAKSDTPSQSNRPRGPRRRPLPERQRLLLVGGVVSVLFLGTLGYFLVKYVFFQPPPVQVTRPPLQVSRQAGSKANSYRSIGQALRYAQAGDVIELHDEVHEESLIVDPAREMTTSVIVQAAPGKEVLWTAPKKEEVNYLIYLNRARNFRLRGKGITLDGGGKVRDLVFISSHCPGLSVEDVQCKGFARTAVTIMNGMGSRDEPIRLVNLHGTTGAQEKPLAGIYLDAHAKSQPSYDDYIHIGEDCTFAGLEPADAVRRKDKSVTGGNINWRFE